MDLNYKSPKLRIYLLFGFKNLDNQPLKKYTVLNFHGPPPPPWFKRLNSVTCFLNCFAPGMYPPKLR